MIQLFLPSALIHLTLARTNDEADIYQIEDAFENFKERGAHPPPLLASLPGRIPIMLVSPSAPQDGLTVEISNRPHEQSQL
eukprot:1077650-Pyramimonas_sp.AAC.1